MQTIWLAFITGITTGGISCMAVQGGLLASSIAQQKELEKNSDGNWKFVGAFLTTKVIAYTVLGLLLGFLGSLIVLTPVIQGYFQIAIGIFLIGTAGYILNLHPFFRYFAIKPPKFIYRLARIESKKSGIFTPALLGSLTVFMPCGVTQAMMVVALGTADPIQSALIMFAFTLGTSPVFFLLGLAASKVFQKKEFRYVSALVLIIFGIISINTGQVLRGSFHNLSSYYKVLSKNENSSSSIAGANTEGVQEVTIFAQNSGYKSNVNTIRAEQPVRLTVITNKTKGCSRAFTIPSLGVSKILPETGEEIIEFTPNEKGVLRYTCSMGMYSGSFKII